MHGTKTFERERKLELCVCVFACAQVHKYLCFSVILFAALHLCILYECSKYVICTVM